MGLGEVFLPMCQWKLAAVGDFTELGRMWLQLARSVATYFPEEYVLSDHPCSARGVRHHPMCFV
jgi:hypothetical protein